jgi:hypothetical protein
MANYFKLKVGAIYLENSDFSRPKLQLDLDTYAPTTAVKYWSGIISASTGGTTVELGNFSSILALVVQNKDSTNYVDMEWTYTDGAVADTANKQQLVKGGLLVLSGTVKVSSDLVFTADTAACDVEVTIVGY